MTLQEALEAIYRDKGRLDPEEIEQDARDEQHPLHGYLEWDDSEAARRYRVVEVARLIRSVHITREVHHPKPRKVEVRAFCSTRDDRRYVPMSVVENDPALMNMVREQMRRELADLKAKYQAHESVFAELMQEVFSLTA
jgi:hypothetical protein